MSPQSRVGALASPADEEEDDEKSTWNTWASSAVKTTTPMIDASNSAQALTVRGWGA